MRWYLVIIAVYQNKISNEQNCIYWCMEYNQFLHVPLKLARIHAAHGFLFL